jgi:hypothetical protein
MHFGDSWQGLLTTLLTGDTSILSAGNGFSSGSRRSVSRSAFAMSDYSDEMPRRERSSEFGQTREALDVGHGLSFSG